MYANEKQNWDDLKQPGDWLRSKYYQTDEFAGIVMICKCGDQISLSARVHKFESFEPLTISPSIGHIGPNGEHYKCHYFIRNGEYVQA